MQNKHTPVYCNKTCKSSFACDRKHGAIYGPNLYTDPDQPGKVFVAKDREQWSWLTESCAYCGQDV